MRKRSYRAGLRITMGVIGVVVLAGLFCLRYQRFRAGDPQAPAFDNGLAPPWFVDVTEEVGLDFTHDAGPVAGYFLPQIMGSGAAFFDFNNDGLLDIYLLQNGGPQGARNRLYQQLPDGRFQDVSAGSGLDIAGYNMGVAVGDVNNDGLPDVVVTQYGGIKLFLNQGNGTFRDATAESGLKNPEWGCSAALLDYDRDGWLDLVVANYVRYDPNLDCPSPDGRPDYCPPHRYTGSPTRLFRNCGPVAGARGKTVRFQDVTDKSGLAGGPGPGLGVVCADFDGDGWPDILISNDAEPNRLWINRRNGTFSDEAAVRGIAFSRVGQAEAGMGIALGDVGGSDLLDVFITHLAKETHTLWRQGPRGLFEDQTVQAGLRRSEWRGTGFGTILGDFDNDGALDLALVNGSVYRISTPPDSALGPHWSLYAERNQLFANDGTGHFRDLSLHNPDLCGTPNVARGLAYADIGGRGALDLLVTTVAGKARLYRNVASGGGHWLTVRAVDPNQGGRDAYGAEVRVHAGGRHWLRLVNPASSYLCSNDPRAHFGLGSVDHVERIDIRWPDGMVDHFPSCAVDQQLLLSRGAGAHQGRISKPDGQVAR
jgi:enediyne biosynthesis protein E4